MGLFDAFFIVLRSLFSATKCVGCSAARCLHVWQRGVAKALHV